MRLADLQAGLTTAVMLVPQAMAYAMLAGLDPIVGLYASTVPLLAYALLGTSRQLAVGPVAMVSLLVATGVGELAGGDPVRMAALAGGLALLVGLVQGGMGALGLGFVATFLGHPVVAGFTSAAALIIGASQLRHVLGIKLESSESALQIVWEAAQHLSEASLSTVALSAATLLVLFLLKRFAPGFPRFLLVVGLGSAAVYLFGLPVATVGPVPRGLPLPNLPAVSLGDAWALVPTALTISFIGFAESISVAKAFARKHRYEVDANKELLALGAANLASGLFSGYPVTGGFSRTAVNDQAGAVSTRAGLVTAAVVAVALLLLTPAFAYLPKAVLAAIILAAVASLVDVAEARHLWRTSRSDLALMGLTFVATLVLGVEVGLLCGVVASLLMFVWHTSRPHVALLGEVAGTGLYRNVARYPEAVRTPGILVVRIDAPLFFANTAFLKETLRRLEATATPLRHVIIDAAAIGSVDSQAMAVLRDIVLGYKDRDVEVWFSGVRGPVRDAFARDGLTERVGQDHLTERTHDAVQAATEARYAATA